MFRLYIHPSSQSFKRCHCYLIISKTIRPLFSLSKSQSASKLSSKTYFSEAINKAISSTKAYWINCQAHQQKTKKLSTMIPDIQQFPAWQGNRNPISVMQMATWMNGIKLSIHKEKSTWVCKVGRAWQQRVQKKLVKRRWTAKAYPAPVLFLISSQHSSQNVLLGRQNESNHFLPSLHTQQVSVSRKLSMAF